MYRHPPILMASRVVEKLVPPWLEKLLTTTFFSACRKHSDAARSECNMFCTDCPAAAAFCFHCRASGHFDHNAIQIRRSSYHDVVRVDEIQRLLDVAGVQTYVINSARVLFLNERPQPRGGGSSASISIEKAHVSICEVCSRTLLDSFRFCSLGCKLERNRRRGDACFVLDEDEEDSDEDSDLMRESTVTINCGRTRRRNVIGGSGGEEEIVRLSPPSASSTSAHTRRRKGVPHRSPLAS